MEAQGQAEPTGKAKITPAYNLPCDYVIHTVGPIVQGRLTGEHCRLLESAYKSCLEIAVQNNVQSIAFCCISTGVFGFPQDRAAEIAVRTVREFRQRNDIKVIFNVFKEDDHEIYKRLLGGN
jgi:O-acetyl-ADP-ribose deacetylase (regulator of RNase III)